MNSAIAVITLLVISAAAYTDIRWSKVYNYVTLPAIIVGLALNTIAGGTHGLLLSIEGVGIAFAIFLFSSQLGRILGGGDIKLLGAVGALLGAPTLGWAIAYIALIGGVLAIAVALSRGILGQCLKRLWAAVCLKAFAGSPMEIEGDERAKARLPYAVPIFLGTVVAMCGVHIAF